jgi:hypothetical protein
MKRLTHVLAIAILATFALSCTVVIADTCDETAPRSAEIDVEGATRVVIDAGAGSLDVRGVDGATSVRARGEACASSESVLEDIRLVADRRGDTVRIETVFPRNWNGNARLDLEVELPTDLEVVIDDGSGSITVEGVASLHLDDGSGDVKISNVAGDVGIDDGSGDLELLGIGGDVTVEDGSGNIDIAGVGGEIRIDDGSGNIEVRDGDRDVIITEDGSGNIRIAGIGGSGIVREDGSGDIDVSDVRGDLRVDDDGSGGVSHDRIDGRVTIDD